jgi:hypothetical protein
MPHHTILVGSDGAVIDIAVMVGPIMRQDLLSRGALPLQPVIIRALIDTGADLTAIHPQILEQFGGRPAGSARIRRPGQSLGYQAVSLFEIQLSIGGVTPGVPWIPTRVVGVEPATPTVLAMIGRDVLKHCTLYYNGPGSELTLSH